MNDETLAELRKLRHIAEDQDRQSHYRAIGGHFTRFVILLAASRLAPASTLEELRWFAGAAGLIFVVMAGWHLFALMPAKIPDEPRPPRRPVAPPSP